MSQQRVLRSFQILAQQPQCLRVARTQTPWSRAVLKAAPVASTSQPSRRWYSSEPEAKKEEQKENAQGTGKEETKDDPIQKELETKKKENVDLTDRLKRSVADYRNLQEQTKREVQAARDFALQRFAKDLLDSIDNLDLAMQSVPQDKLTDANKDLMTLHSGVKMTESILLKTLAKHGLERFDPSVEGDAFDPNKHEATFQTPQPDKKDGTVFYTQQKGFLYNGRVLRAAKVGVVKNS